MKKILINNLEFELFLSNQDVHSTILNLANQINNDYSGREVILLTVLKGAIFFTVDLMRELTIDCKLETITAKSYGNKMTTSGDVDIQDLDLEFEGKEIILVEDIVDTGYTIKALIEKLNSKNPKTLEIAALFSKKDQRKVSLEVKYVGIEIPSYFIVGYGLDYAEYGRNFKDIYIHYPK